MARSLYPLFFPVADIVWTFAAEHGHAHMLTALSEIRGTPFVDEHGRTPLAIAALAGRAEAVRIFLDQPNSGDWVNREDERGDTPVHLAALGGHVEAVRALLDDPRTHAGMSNRGGNTPLHHACLVGSLGTTKLVAARRELDPLKMNVDGKTAMELLEGSDGPSHLAQPLEAWIGNYLHSQEKIAAKNLGKRKRT